VERLEEEKPSFFEKTVSAHAVTLIPWRLIPARVELDSLRKQSFFEKKDQKTFVSSPSIGDGQNLSGANRQKLFASFSRKRRPSAFPCVSLKAGCRGSTCPGGNRRDGPLRVLRAVVVNLAVARQKS
jgi:hypothetical protein